MTIHTPFRGIRAVRANARDLDPNAILGELNTAFAAFKDRNNARLANIESGLADLANRHAGLDLGARGVPQSAERREVNAALRSFIRNGDEGPLAALVGAPQAGMSVGSDPNGGYVVYPTISEAITARVFDISPMRQIARVVPVSSASWEELFDIEEAAAEWVGETQARPQTTTPRLGVLNVPVHELYAMPAVTQKLLDDSAIDLASWLTEKCASRFARKEGQAFITGDGILKPRGLLTYPTSLQDDDARPWGTLQHVNTGTSGGFGTAPGGSDALIDLVYSLKTEYRANARFMMNRKTAGLVRKMKDGDGNYLWQPSAMAGEPDRLMGFPVTLCEEMPDVAASSLSVAFGDFREGYVIPDRHELRLLRDPLTAKPNILFYCYRRMGGAVANFDAVKLLRFAVSG